MEQHATHVYSRLLTVLAERVRAKKNPLTAKPKQFAGSGPTPLSNQAVIVSMSRLSTRGAQCTKSTVSWSAALVE